MICPLLCKAENCVWKENKFLRRASQVCWCKGWKLVLLRGGFNLGADLTLLVCFGATGKEL